MRLHDLKYAIRTLRRSPGYTLAALLTLILGIGANTAVFSVVHGILLAPLPYPDADRLVLVREVNGNGRPMAAAWRNFVDWRDRTRSLDGLVAWNSWTSTVLGAGAPLRTEVARISEGFFETVGVPPVRGRAPASAEHVRGAAPAVVVSDGFWRTHLGGDPDFTSRTLTVGSHSAQVIGVMPPAFAYPADAEIWIPLELDEQAESRTSHNYRVLGRLRPGLALEAADADLDAITASFLDEDPGVVNETWFEGFFPREVTIETLHAATVADSRRALLILLGASVLVLLVACTNLASATLARGTGREREIAVRRSLGAARGQVVRQLFVEALVLATTGGALALALAWAMIRVLPALAPAGIPRIGEVTLDAPVVATAFLVALATAVLFGLLPALRVSDGRFAETLRSGGRGGHDRGRHRVWKALITLEVALALLLVAGSGLLIRSFFSVLAVHPGYRTESVLTATLSPPDQRYPDGAARRSYYERLLAELQASPVVEAVGLTSSAPLSSVPNGDIPVRRATGDGSVIGDYFVISDDYFRALDIPLLAGRTFNERDRDGAPHVVVVNRAFAALAWPGEDPLGKEMKGGGMDDYWDKDVWATVIGVVDDIRQSDLTREPEPALYFSYRQRPFRTWSMTALVRPRTTIDAVGPAVRDIVRQVDPDVPVAISTIEARLAGSVTPRRFTVFVLGVFAAVALLLACVGIWSVVAYAVATRTREIGIRMALGATAGSVRAHLQRGYLTPVGIGVVIGLALTLATTRVLRSLLYEVRPTDPLTLALTLALLGGAAWLASYVPSLRSTRMSPVETMRAE